MWVTAHKDNLQNGRELMYDGLLGCQDDMRLGKMGVDLHHEMGKWEEVYKYGLLRQHYPVTLRPMI